MKRKLSEKAKITKFFDKLENKGKSIITKIYIFDFFDSDFSGLFKKFIF